MYDRTEWTMILVKKKTRNFVRELSYKQGRKMWEIVEERIRA